MHDLRENDLRVCYVCGRPVESDPLGAVTAQRVIYAVAMNGDRRDVRGPQVVFHRDCFAEHRSNWVETVIS